MKIKFLNKRYVFGIVILIMAGLMCIGYFKYKEYYPTTDDAYVSAYIVDVAPQISGRVDYVYVKDNQLVKKGTLLFTIDPKLYQVVLDRDQAELQSVIAQLKSSQAELSSAKSQEICDKYDYEREKFLVKGHSVSVREYQRIYYKYKESIDEVSNEKALVEQSSAAIDKMKQEVNNDILKLIENS